MIELPLDEPAIRNLLPHSADMCLIQTLLEWTPEHAICETLTHTHRPHPLADGDRLGSANLIEYAAQCMALHGALLGQQAGSPDAAAGSHGVLAGVRKVNLKVADLSLIGEPLALRVSLLSGDSKTAIYDFSVNAGDKLLADGRATVMFITNPPGTQNPT